MNYFLTGLAFIFAGGLISLAFAENYKSKIFSVFSFLGTIFLSIPSVNILFTNTVIEKIFYLPEPIGRVLIEIDPLSAFFILVISIMSFLGTIYLSSYIEPYLNKNKNISSHFLFLSTLICSMLGVVVVQNAIFFLIIWEIMSLSSFFLVIFENNKKEVLSSGINYLIYMHLSVIFITLGLIFLFIKSGSLEFGAFKTVFSSDQIFANIIFLLLFAGFGIKAGFVPFHNWLPKAHPGAPCHISGIMSGVMIKTGIYGILRILSLMDIPSIEISYFVLIISVITALFGILYATAQKNIKKLLAYSSIENIGVIGTGIGVGMIGLSYQNDLVAILGFSGAFLHILNHSIFKEILFFTTGAVYNKTHIKDIEKLGGLIKKMPATASLFLIGAIAITGLPPFNGFISEFLIYLGLLKGIEIKSIYILVIFILSIAALALVGTIALLCFTKVFSIVFLGMPRSEEAKSVESDVSRSMILPISILALFTLLIGLLPQFAIKIVVNPVKVLLKNNLPDNIFIPMGIMKIISLTGFCFISSVLLLLAVKYFIFKNRTAEVQNTWGCGYKNTNSNMQYTASSYASPFLSMLKPFFIKKFDIKRPKELFPKEAHFELNIQDIEEFYIVNPIIKADEKFLSKFQWIQGGNVQQYILFGLVFLILALVGTIFCV